MHITKLWLKPDALLDGIISCIILSTAVQMGLIHYQAGDQTRQPNVPRVGPGAVSKWVSV